MLDQFFPKARQFHGRRARNTSVGVGKLSVKIGQIGSIAGNRLTLFSSLFGKFMSRLFRITRMIQVASPGFQSLKRVLNETFGSPGSGRIRLKGILELRKSGQATARRTTRQ